MVSILQTTHHTRNLKTILTKENPQKPNGNPAVSSRNSTTKNITNQIHTLKIYLHTSKMQFVNHIKAIQLPPNSKLASIDV